MARLYQCLAFSVKENRKSFHLIVLSHMPAMRKHALVCSNSRRCKYGFSLPSPEKGLSRTILIRHGQLIARCCDRFIRFWWPEAFTHAIKTDRNRIKSIHKDEHNNNEENGIKIRKDKSIIQELD